jgi:hypothetical protein
MTGSFLPRANQLRTELMLRNRIYARAHSHIESYGSNPVIVYAPEGDRHGNFHAPAYAAMASRPEWMRRFDKIHSQCRSLPTSPHEESRKWRELDSSMSSDALLMNFFCTPGVIDSIPLQNMLGIDSDAEPIFGWKARVPFRSGRADRTEVDMRWGDLLVEAKLTESDFQSRESSLVESYRDFDLIFDRELLPRVPIRIRRRRQSVELVEDFTQEWEPPSEDAEDVARAFHAEIETRADAQQPWEPGYASYQLIRNVLAAHAADCRFCVIHDQRRPDLREAWFEIMCAVKSSALRSRCKVLTWQELVPLLPEGLQEFLDRKYGIVPPGEIPSPLPELETPA